MDQSSDIPAEQIAVLNNRKRTMRLLLGFVLAICTGSLPAQVALVADVAVSVTASPSKNLTPGEPIVFTVTVTNNGPVALTGFAVDSANEYPEQIDTTTLATDCSDMEFSVVDGSRTYWYLETWYPTDTSSLSRDDWPLDVGESRSCHVTLALAPTAPQTLPFDFHLSSYWHDPNPSNDVGRVVLQRAVPLVPTLSRGALLLLGLLLLSGTWINNATNSRRSSRSTE